MNTSSVNYSYLNGNHQKKKRCTLTVKIMTFLSVCIVSGAVLVGLKVIKLNSESSPPNIPICPVLGEYCVIGDGNNCCGDWVCTNYTCSLPN
jgi:hypothetical protein